MKLLEFFHEDQADWEIKNLDKLDKILTKLAEMVIQGQEQDPDYYGMVAAAVLDPDNNLVARLNFPGKDGQRIHAERAAMMSYTKKYGEIPKGSIIITTLSPCSDHMDDRVGESCTDLINKSPVHKVYCGYMDPTQHEHDTRQFTLQETNSENLRKACKALADTFLDDKIDETAKVKLSRDPDNFGAYVTDKGRTEKTVEIPISKITTFEPDDKFHNPKNSKNLNSIVKAIKSGKEIPPILVRRQKLGYQVLDGHHRFMAHKMLGKKFIPARIVNSYNVTDMDENFADGKNPEHKGDSRRHGIPKHATLAQLDKIAHQGGRKGQLAHWQANMRRGRKKAHESLEENFTSKQQVINYFISRGKSAAQGAAAWERGWRGPTPKKPKEPTPYDPSKYRFPYKDEAFDIGMGQASHGKNGISESINVADFKEILKKFLPVAKKIVKLEQMPTVVLKKTLHGGDQPTHGRFFNDSYTLELAIANRHPVDILRTLAHELVHAKQHEQHVDIDPTTGSPEENEANAVAGIVMRHFNKEYPEYLSFQPLEESKSNGRKRIC